MAVKILYRKISYNCVSPVSQIKLLMKTLKLFYHTKPLNNSEIILYVPDWNNMGAPPHETGLSTLSHALFPHSNH